jgi:hypothetical protein
MRRIMLCGLLLAACAGSEKKDVASGGSALCGITEPRWPAADRDFDRHTTLEAIAALTSAATADLDKLKAGSRGDVGGAIDELYGRPASAAFISHGVAELATRLRQLDCAVRSGRLQPAQAEATYGKILAELAAERRTIDPSAT